MSGEADAAAGPRWQTQVGIGVALLLIAAVLWYDARRLPPGPAMGVGPAAALWLVGGLVAILGLAHFVSAWRARQAGHSQADDRGNHTSLGIVLAALVGQIIILEIGGGFIISSVWLFALTARGFGEKLGPKLIGIGVAISFAVYLFFTTALSLALPTGPLERLMG